MSLDPRHELAKNLKVALQLREFAKVIASVPTAAAEYYANGGAGVGQAVVGDRFQGVGNERFAPLSGTYAEWKAGKSSAFNKSQKTTFGRGSRMVVARTHDKRKIGKILPILVLTGTLRARVMARGHKVHQQGDTAFVTFINLPEYAEAHHKPIKAPFPKRSPVEPNAADLVRVSEFIDRRITALIARLNMGAVSFGDGKARII